MIKEIKKIKNLMGLIIENVENNNCYPSDYKSGKTYERNELSKIFSCLAGEKDFPVDGVKEWMFPLIPDDKKGHKSPIYDPKNMNMGYDKPITMEELVTKYKNKISNLTLKTISLTPKELHSDTLKFIPIKKSVYMGKERIKYQMEKALKDGMESLTEKEPFVVEIIDDKYKWAEGWNRLIALINLYKQGKIKIIKGKSWIVNHK